MIVCSAFRYKGKIYTGKRHWECMHQAHEETRDSGLFDEQGFLTDTGRFLSRKQAEAHARKCGQLTKPLIGSVLTSEDLW